MEFKDLLKNRRQELGLTLAEVGKSVGVAKATVQRWESGNIKNIKRDKIYSLSKVLKTTPEYLMGWDTNVNQIEPKSMLPIVGVIRAGMPILAQENIEGYYPAPVNNTEEHFYLRVSGDSMINAGIKNKSLVLIKKQNTAEDGQIVACRVNGNEATLKRFKHAKDTIVLMPENSDYQPIIVSNNDFETGYAEIIGVAKSVVTEL